MVVAFWTTDEISSIPNQIGLDGHEQTDLKTAMAITYTPARQRTFVAAPPASNMDIDYEPPRKREGLHTTRRG